MALGVLMRSHLQWEAPFKIEIPKPHSRKQLTI